jgi:hypothetical protein
MVNGIQGCQVNGGKPESNEGAAFAAPSLP